MWMVCMYDEACNQVRARAPRHSGQPRYLDIDRPTVNHILPRRNAKEASHALSIIP